MEKELYAVKRIPEGTVKAVIFVLHGVTEHSGRYADFSEKLEQENIASIIFDLPGHGMNVKRGEKPMSFGNEGWDGAVDRVYKSIKKEKENFTNIPCFLLGFSMGSFIVRTLLIKYPSLNLNGAILVGTGHQSKIALSLGSMLVNSEIKKYGRDSFTEKIDAMAFDGYNKAFKPNKTRMDWLCSNEKALQEYMADSLVGKGFTAGLFADLLYGMKICVDQKNINKMNKNVPILLLSGKNDSVGENGRGIHIVSSSFNKAGIQNSIRLYNGMRHDIFHEKDSYLVIKDIIQWINENCK